MNTKEIKNEINLVIGMDVAEFAKKNNISLDDIINQTIEKADILIKDLRPFNSVTFNLPINGCDCIWKIRLESTQILDKCEKPHYTFTLVDLRLTENMPEIWGIKRGDYYYFNKSNVKDMLGNIVSPGEYKVADDRSEFLGCEIIKIKPSLMNPERSLYAFKKLGFYDHFDTAKLREITIANADGKYLLTDSEDKGLRIFAELINNPVYRSLLSTLDLEKFKEKLIQTKEID